PGEVREGHCRQEEVAASTAPTPGFRGRAPFVCSGSQTRRRGVSTDRLSTLLEEYAQLEKQMEDPSIHSDQALVRRVGRRFAELAPLYAANAELEAAPIGR